MGVYDVELWLPTDSRASDDEYAQEWLIQDCLGFPSSHTVHTTDAIDTPFCVFKRDNVEVVYQFTPTGWKAQDSIITSTLRDGKSNGG